MRYSGFRSDPCYLRSDLGTPDSGPARMYASQRALGRYCHRLGARRVSIERINCP